MTAVVVAAALPVPDAVTDASPVPLLVGLVAPVTARSATVSGVDIPRVAVNLTVARLVVALPEPR